MGTWSSLVLLGLYFCQLWCAEGSVCHRMVWEYRRYRVCNTWCWSHHWEWRPVWVTKQYCCPGYIGSVWSGCKTPVCNPPCQNGGQCIRPDKCQCRHGYQGPACDGKTPCSYTKPCFPGICTANKDCICSEDFKGSTCDHLQTSARPHIIYSSSFLMNKARESGVNKYRFKTESANLDANVFWVPHVPSKDQINFVNVYFDAMFTPRNRTIMHRREYIEDFAIGITHGEVEYKLQPLPRQGDKLIFPDTTDTPCSASYLDLFLKYDPNGKLYTRIYDKRDDFNFSIVNFPFLCSNIPASPAYGVYISQLIRYGRACSYYEDFIARGQLLTTRLQHQGYTTPRLKSTFRKFFGRQHDIVGLYEKSASGQNSNQLTVVKTCANPTSLDRPETSIFHCNITDPDFVWLIEHGTNLTFTIRVKAGGFRKDWNPDNHQHYRSIHFNGEASTKQIEYRFDYETPYHCLHNCSGQSALHVDRDITKSKPLRFSCSGWHDDLAGVNVYTYQIYPLKADYDGNLTEESPASPIMFHAINASLNNPSTCPDFSYDPPAAGMYSVLLEVADKANNTKYARRVFLFDDESHISFNDDSNSRLYISSAENETGNLWQANLQNENGVGTPIQVVWNNHFVNKHHENGKWLNRVNNYKSQFLMDVRLKNVETAYDDYDGNRTIKAIRNIHGIVKTEIAFERDHKGGSTITKVPDAKWTTVQDFTTERYTINASRSDGDSIRVWIKAYDIMGNTKIDSTLVSFDSTSPRIVQTDIRKNINGTYPFMSRVDLKTEDGESGIYQIKWKIVSNGSDAKEFRNGKIAGNSTTEHPIPGEGFCIPSDLCYFFEHRVDINNCWFVVPKDKLKTQITDIHLDVYNMAMLKTSTTIQISDLMSLRGMEDYAGPMNVRVTQTHANSVRFEWDQAPSCYGRSEIMLMYNVSGTVNTMHIHKDARYYDLSGLTPESSYTVQFVTQYGHEKSDPVTFSFTTGKKEGLSAGAIAGISIVIVILLGLVIAFVILWRTGKLNKAKESIYGHIERRRTRRNNDSFTGAPTAHHNMAYNEAFKQNKTATAADDCDIYLYGNMPFNEIWEIPRGSISLVEKITSGRFADIFKANHQCKQNDKRTVVAKVLKESLKEDDELLMKAKINFFANKVGTHTNVIGFIGAVMDNESLGPMMILEYCEVGPMRKWLQQKNSNVTESTIDTLYRFAFDVAKGMKHLASKEIVHNSLAARNILLTFNLEAKIAGFGPNKESENNDNRPENERIPVKWMAPECMKTLKNADFQSDVWSYGIVLWEIFSLGEMPYPGISSKDVHKKVTSGYTMPRPEFCTDLHNQMMKDCWKLQPKSRPTFKSIEVDLAATFSVNRSSECYYYT